MNDSESHPGRLDPLEPNPFAATVVDEEHAGTRIRPTGVTVTGVFTSIAAALGLMGSVFGLVMLAVNTAIQDALTPAGRAGQAQRSLNEAIADVNAKYMPVNIALLIVLGVLSVLLLVGAIKLLGGKRQGRTMLAKLFIVMCGFEVVRTIPVFMTQAEMAPIMKRYLRDAGTGNGAQPSAEMTDQFAQMGVIVGMVFAGGWLLVKISLYLWGHFYLKSQKAVAFCQQ